MTNDMPDRPSPRPAATRRIPLAIGAVLIGAVIGFAGVYGIGGLKRDAGGDSACRPAVDLARKLAPLAHGEVAALTMATVPLRLPDLAFEDTDGKPKKPRFFKILKLSDGQWGCRPRCWSMVKAARSPPSPGPRNGAATTPSS